MGVGFKVWLAAGLAHRGEIFHEVDDGDAVRFHAFFEFSERGVLQAYLDSKETWAGSGDRIYGGYAS